MFWALYLALIVITSPDGAIIVSARAPLAQALLGKTVGQVIDFRRSLTILSILF